MRHKEIFTRYWIISHRWIPDHNQYKPRSSNWWIWPSFQLADKKQICTNSLLIEMLQMVQTYLGGKVSVYQWPSRGWTVLISFSSPFWIFWHCALNSAQSSLRMKIFMKGGHLFVFSPSPPVRFSCILPPALPFFPRPWSVSSVEFYLVRLLSGQVLHVKTIKKSCHG